MATYAMSDVHGMYGLYRKMLKKIRFGDGDVLWFLGDAVDRGPEPMAVLSDLMGRGNVRMLLGNHELMMYDALAGGGMSARSLWHANGGAVTERQFLSLPAAERDAALDFIEGLPVVAEAEAGGRRFYLAHASPLWDEPPDPCTMLDLPRRAVEGAVWDRDYPFPYVSRMPAWERYKDHVLVAGHTFTAALTGRADAPMGIFTGCGGHYVNIDCGCAALACGTRAGRLGCLRLDDMKQFYVGP